MDLNIKCKSLQVLAWGNNSVDVTLEKVEQNEILDHFTERDILNHFDLNRLLDEIGSKECRDYFDLIDNDYK